jgi:nucleoside-diphosphate-sugar epimerase
MRSLVSGASGHLGSYLTRLLIARGEEVTILVRPSSDLWRLDGVLDQVRVIRAPLEDLEPLANELRGAVPDTVFHLAWSGVTADTRNHSDTLIDNVTGALRLFRIAREAGCGCWVGLGSQAEYGPQAAPLAEHLAPRPDTVYGVAKLSLGQMLAALCGAAGMRFVWLRLLAAYGPKDDPRHLIPSVIETLLSGARPALTAGEQLWDYLYVEDAAEAIYRAAATQAAEGMYNLASGHAETVRRMVERLRDMIDPELALGFGEIPYGPGGPMSIRADAGKLRNATGWSAATDLESGLRRTLEWHRSKSGKNENIRLHCGNPV